MFWVFSLSSDALEEHGLDESDSISLDRSNSGNPKKPSTPVSRQFVDESLHDEDAWMPILAVANAEVTLRLSVSLPPFAVVSLSARCSQSLGTCSTSNQDVDSSLEIVVCVLSFSSN